MASVNDFASMLQSLLGLASMGPVGWAIIAVIVLGLGVLWWISSRNKIAQAKKESVEQATKDQASNAPQNVTIEDKAKAAEDKIKEIKSQHSGTEKKKR